MVILQVYHTLGLGGVGNYLLRLCAQLVDHGHRVLLAGPDGEMMPKFEEAGISCFRMPIRDWRLWRRGRNLADIIRREKVHVLNAHDHAAGPAAWLAARRTGTPYLLTIHCRRPFWQRLAMFYWSPKVAAVSPGLREHLIREFGLSPERVVETITGVDVDRFRPGPASDVLAAELGIQNRWPVLLHVSRFSPGKSHVALALIQAARLLARAFPHLALLLVGFGKDERKIRTAAERLNRSFAQPVIHSLGARPKKAFGEPVPRDDIPELMRLATITIGTGMVILEALACGCPVVAAGKFGFIGPVTPGSFSFARQNHFGDHGGRTPTTPENLAEAILRLLSDPGLRQELTHWGRRIVVEQFSTQRMVDQVENLYAEMHPRDA
jgi:glycosyltransferase involved in cell wall biosynthesis